MYLDEYPVYQNVSPCVFRSLYAVLRLPDTQCVPLKQVGYGEGTIIYVRTPEWRCRLVENEFSFLTYLLHGAESLES